MKLRGLIDEDFSNYQEPSMFLIFPHCNFKCCIEAGNNICQNMDVIKEPEVDVEVESLVKRYLGNPITKSIVCGGLEPLDSFEDLLIFIHTLRWEYDCFDTVVIYTGYNADEVVEKVYTLSKFTNIIVKFGRFIPNQKEHYDEVLGVNLSSDNQYAVRL